MHAAPQIAARLERGDLIMRRHRPLLLARSLAAGASVLGLLAAAPAAMADVPGTGSATHPAPAGARAAALAALRDLAIGQHATDHRAGSRLAQQLSGLAQTRSTNWSGYADNNSTGRSYTRVSASWTEPPVSCSGTATSLAAFWTGIDGYGSGSVEQDGTLAECYLGTAYYYTWWEM
jgi:Peptidase A4 family